MSSSFGVALQLFVEVVDGRVGGLGRVDARNLEEVEQRDPVVEVHVGGLHGRRHRRTDRSVPGARDDHPHAGIRVFHLQGSARRQDSVVEPGQ